MTENIFTKLNLLQNDLAINLAMHYTFTRFEKSLIDFENVSNMKDNLKRPNDDKLQEQFKKMGQCKSVSLSDYFFIGYILATNENHFFVLYEIIEEPHYIVRFKSDGKEGFDKFIKPLVEKLKLTSSDVWELMKIIGLERTIIKKN